ncbi:vanomycin resistance protein VanB, partial [Amycolatopsis mediterranei]
MADEEVREGAETLEADRAHAAAESVTVEATAAEVWPDAQQELPAVEQAPATAAPEPVIDPPTAATPAPADSPTAAAAPPVP